MTPIIQEARSQLTDAIARQLALRLLAEELERTAARWERQERRTTVVIETTCEVLES